MDVREKLIELLDTNCGYVDEVKAEVLSDRLIANGVTVQENCKDCAESTKNCIVKLQEQIADLRSAQKWIPVTERLPEIGRKCLIANGEIVKVGWIRPDGVWKTGVSHNDLWGRFSLYPPTHWMPLPEPPREDAK